MRIALLVTLIASLGSASASADTGEATPGNPYTLALEGPTTVPVSIELKPGSESKPKLFVEVWMDGKGLKRVTLPPSRLGSTMLTVPAGRHVFEFRADPASRAAVLSWNAPKSVAGSVWEADPVDPERAVVARAPVVAATEGPAISRTKGAEQLARSYQPTVGEVLAADLFQVMVAIRATSDFTTVAYDKTSRTIVLSILGGDSSVDGAKRAIEELRSKAIDRLSYRAESTLGVALEDADFTIRYLNRNQEYREVVRREGGRYVIAE